MSVPNLSDGLKQFIARHLNSVEQVEVLLLMKRTFPREWTADQLSRELASSKYSAESRLLDLRSRGLLLYREDQQDLHFRYHPDNPENALISELAQLYTERRTTIITMIFSKPADNMTSFADAFRLRRPGPP